MCVCVCVIVCMGGWGKAYVYTCVPVFTCACVYVHKVQLKVNVVSAHELWLSNEPVLYRTNAGLSSLPSLQ